MNEGLRRGALAARQTGVALVLSDFLDPAGYEAGLNALVGAGFSSQRCSNPGAGGIEPADLRRFAPGGLARPAHLQEVTFGKYRLKAYQQTVQNFRQRLREFCTGRGISFFSVSSDASLESLLLKQLRQAEIWG